MSADSGGTVDPGELAVAAVDAAFPPTPLNIMARRINRLAELLPKDHECEPIFGEFDALGEYVEGLESQVLDLGELCDKYGLPHSVEVLHRHLVNNAAFVYGLKDRTIKLLEEKLAAAQLGRS
jgi:hypothetical protein